MFNYFTVMVLLRVYQQYFIPIVILLFKFTYILFRLIVWWYYCVSIMTLLKANHHCFIMFLWWYYWEFTYTVSLYYSSGIIASLPTLFHYATLVALLIVNLHCSNILMWFYLQCFITLLWWYNWEFTYTVSLCYPNGII